MLKMIYANLMGYFWMPCPLCGEYFGGFESGKGAIDIDGKRKVVCKECDYEAGVIDGIKGRGFVTERAWKIIQAHDNQIGE